MLLQGTSKVHNKCNVHSKCKLKFLDFSLEISKVNGKHYLTFFAKNKVQPLSDSELVQ